MPEIIPNLHPAVVHFPLALMTVSLLFHVAAMLFKNRLWSSQLATVAHWTLWLGALSSIVAAGFGWQAYNTVNHDEPAHVAMLVHRNWALPTMGLMVLLAAWDIWKSKATQVMSLLFILPLAIVWGLVMTTGWYGAELVYRHGLGVMSLPAAEAGHEHHHHEEEANDDDHPAADPETHDHAN